MKTNKSEAPFNTEAYANYKALVDKEREQIAMDKFLSNNY